MQLSLPATWASRFISNRDPREQLATLRDDLLDSKAEIRLALERLAERHRIPLKEVTRALGAVDDGLSDFVHGVGRGFISEIEEESGYS